jgi:hypothetical protein
MNNVIKAYFFIPSGFRNFIEYAFDGWRFVFFLYLLFSAILAVVTASSLEAGTYILLQPILLLLVLSLLTAANAFGMGAHEPIIKGMRLVALCLPPIGLTLLFIAEKSALAYFGVYPALLYIVGSAYLGPRGKLINSAMGTAVMALTCALLYFQATTTGKWLGQELTIKGHEIRLTEIPAFTDDESRILRFIVLATPRLGHLPQADEISDSLSLDRVRIQNALQSLDRRGRIVLGADGEIRYAFPWAAYDNGYLVIMEKEGAAPERVFAASALHALSVTHIFKGWRVDIYTRLKDTGEPLMIKARDGQIDTTNYPDALVYKGETISEINFYSSPTGAKVSFRGRFDATRLLDLDRAMAVADELLKKRTSGLFN